MLQIQAVIFLSFVLAAGFLLVILSCALWNNWLPLLVGEYRTATRGELLADSSVHVCPRAAAKLDLLPVCAGRRHFARVQLGVCRLWALPHGRACGEYGAGRGAIREDAES